MDQVSKFQAVKQSAIDSGLLDSKTEHSVVGNVLSVEGFEQVYPFLAAYFNNSKVLQGS